MLIGNGNWKRWDATWKDTVINNLCVNIILGNV